LSKVVFSIDIQNANEAILKALKSGIETVAERAFELSQRERKGWPGKTGTPVYTGILKGSGQVIQKSDVEYVLTYGEGAEYAALIEYGSGPRPGFKAGSIVTWVHRKLNIAKTKKGKNHAWAIATNIAKKIRSKGNTPQPYVRPAFDEVLPEVDGIMKRAVEKELK
jgi:hypothetical protein|tara:strand:- start:1841 stop:2338 length:498 start_codon:yes stop_codon:yes gene_type:complete